MIRSLAMSQRLMGTEEIVLTNVRASLARIRDNPFLPRTDKVSGLV